MNIIIAQYLQDVQYNCNNENVMDFGNKSLVLTNGKIVLLFEDGVQQCPFHIACP